MLGHDIIVVGASAGGVEALTQLMSSLPPDLPAAIFVVLHIPAQSPSVMPDILNRAIKKRQPNSLIKAVHPHDGEKIEHGRIYVAPPNYHLLVKEGHIRLARGPKENNHRPAVDPLFRTAARVYGSRVIGLILSGTLDDGTAGLLAVKQQGGVAIVQDPEEALYSGMPSSAIENVAVDHILRVSQIAPLLVELANQPVQEQKVNAVSSEMKMEADMAELEVGAMNNPNRPGKPSPFACPDCNGVLWELDEERLIRFRCRTGHAYSTGSLLAKQTDAQEEALWNALRALEEKAALTQRLAERARDRNQPISAKRFEHDAQVAYQRATLVRQLLLKPDSNGDLSTFNGQIVANQTLLGNGDSTNSGSGKGGEFPIQNPKLTSERFVSLKGKLREGSKIENSSSDLHIVAICASAGGLKAISQVLSTLPADFPAAITIVQHLSPNHPSAMADLLSRRTKLSVKQAEQGDLLQPGCVYIAPPDQHLLVNPDSTLCLSHSELVNFSRPSADLLFESVAASFKQRAIAIVLSGTGSDGAMGVKAIKQMGGTVIAQEQASCEFFAMPLSAINTGNVDKIVPLNDIATTLISLVTTEETYRK